DLRELALAAVRGGADCLAMAGGDGSQAPVAGGDAEAGVAFLGVPPGARTHLGLDLGLDRTGPRNAADAVTKGVQTRVDLGYVGGQVCVTNGAMGAYAEIVHEGSCRDAKFSTTATKLPELMAAEGTPADLRFTDPDGKEYTTADVLMV